MQLEKISLSIRSELAAMEEVLRTTTASSVPLITQVIHYIIDNGGKRIRPTLTLLAARMCGYGGDAAPRIGAAVEMVHTASLMHDDVVDNAPTRRGKPSANAKWGNQISVLVGDFFWCKACELIVRHGDHRILSAITNAIVGTTEGEVLELTKSNDLAIDEEVYLKIIRHKTAVLLAAACQVGAMLGGVSETLESALQRFGHDLGVAFQLADDVLDYVSEEERFGKSKGSDLREGRLTLPLIVTIKQCTEAERTLIKDALLSHTVSEAQLAAITQIINKYGGIDYTSNRAYAFVEQAKGHLAPFKPSLEQEALLTLADYVIHRQE
ncbi:MAG: polyprenyl synthetase family protein [Deltaproteobacteria bacterium]|nr:polyprenyl synthetase family protein [Deltaproteobacteria bacterium]